ncbi:MAG: hypothetical protein ACKOPO_05055 [Novosphingobium sp.]
MALLPETYAALEPFAEGWSLPTAAERATRRSRSTLEERQAFYDAVSPLAAQILDELDVKPLAELDASEQRLLNLVLAYGHVALAIEIQGPDEAQHTRWRDRMIVTRSPADLAA